MPQTLYWETHGTTDPDNDVLTYSVSGTDVTSFAEAFSQHTGLGYISVKQGGQP